MIVTPMAQSRALHLCFTPVVCTSEISLQRDVGYDDVIRARAAHVLELRYVHTIQLFSSSTSINL